MIYSYTSIFISVKTIGINIYKKADTILIVRWLEEALPYSQESP